MESLLSFCGNHKKIYIYGAGRFGRELCVFLDENKLRIEGFLVTKKDAGIKQVLNKNIIEISDLDFREEGLGIVLAVGKRFSQEMLGTLRQKGVEDVFCFGEDLLQELEKSFEFTGSYSTNQYVNVLLYHRIENLEKDDWNIAVSPENFEEQIKWISENYPVLRFEDDWCKANSPSVVITFDDGYNDNLVNALPILEKYRVPATFFISTENLPCGGFFWWDTLSAKMKGCEKDELMKEHDRLRQMKSEQRVAELANHPVHLDQKNKSISLSELKKLAASKYVDIGVHTVTHSSLSSLDEKRQEKEISESIQVLEQHLGKTMGAFSYPLGDYNETTIKLIKKYGIKKAATVAGGLAGTGDSLRIPRNVVRDWDLGKFKRFIQTCFCVYAEVRE